MLAEQMRERGCIRTHRVLAFADLCELRWVAEQHDVLRACRDRKRIRERDLSGLVDEEVVQLAVVLGPR